MGGRGSDFGNSGGAGVTAAQNKTVDRLVKRTRDLKNEQYRVVNENGEVVLEKKGGRGEVSATVGEKRQFLTGAVTIHNHPDGGTFSDADLNEFGFGARQLVVASHEGTYKLTNTKYGTKDQSKGWLDMRNAMDAAGITGREMSFTELRKQAQQQPAVARQMKTMQKTSERWVKARQEGKPQATLDRLMAQYNRQDTKYKSLLKDAQRQVETKPYHDFYRKNASKYGFKYEFTKR